MAGCSMAVAGASAAGPSTLAAHVIDAAHATRRDGDAAAACSSGRASLPKAARRWTDPLAMADKSPVGAFAHHRCCRPALAMTPSGSSPRSSSCSSASAMVAVAATSAAAACESASGFCAYLRSSHRRRLKRLSAIVVNTDGHGGCGDGWTQRLLGLREAKEVRGRCGRGSEKVRRRFERRGVVVANAFDEEVNWEVEMDEDDLRTGLNEVSNKAIRVMLSGDIQALGEMKDEINYLGEYLAQEEQWDAARFMLVLLGLLEHKVTEEADRLDGMYKEAFEKIGQVIDDSGWALAKPGKELPGEDMIDDELIPPVLQTPY